MTADIWNFIATTCKCARGGDKVTYIVSVLSERYSVSERKIYSIIKHLETDCTSGAV